MFFGKFLEIIFVFRAEDGIRFLYVTGVQTCALPICPPGPNGGCDQVDRDPAQLVIGRGGVASLRRRERAGVSRRQTGTAELLGPGDGAVAGVVQIGRASCRERVSISGVAVSGQLCSK